MLRQQWLTAMAVALRPVDLDRSLALLDESAELATGENLREADTIEFFRGLMLFARRVAN